jgi:3-dehydroquinate synthase
MIGAAAIAQQRGLLPAGAWPAIAEAVDRIGPRPPVSDLRTPQVLDALARDKKARAGRVPFVLPTAIGRVEIHDDVERAEITRALREMAAREPARGPARRER